MTTFGRIAYTNREGEEVPAVVRNREHYTAKVNFEDEIGKRVGSVSLQSPSIAAEALANTALETAMGDTAVRDGPRETYYAQLKCHDPSGDDYYVTFTRKTVRISSYQDDAIKEKIEALGRPGPRAGGKRGHSPVITAPNPVRPYRSRLIAILPVTKNFGLFISFCFKDASIEGIPDPEAALFPQPVHLLRKRRDPPSRFARIKRPIIPVTVEPSLIKKQHIGHDLKGNTPCFARVEFSLKQAHQSLIGGLDHAQPPRLTAAIAAPEGRAR